MRGFQSSVDYRLFFGLEDISSLDSVKIIWNNNEESVLKDIKINFHHIFKESNISKNKIKFREKEKKSIFKPSKNSINYTHIENNFVDFDRERLLFNEFK